MRRRHVLLWLPALLCGIPAAAAGDAFLEDVETALERAARLERPLVIDFFTTWCLPCQEMARTTWRDREVLRALDRCVALAVNAERAPGLAARYGAQSYPTIVITAPDGAIVLRLRGMQDPAAMRDHLHAALEDWNTLAPAAAAAADARPDPGALVTLADFGRERGAWDWSEQLYRRALKRRKKLPEDLLERAQTGLATVYVFTGRCREARRLLPEGAAGACAAVE